MYVNCRYLFLQRERSAINLHLLHTSYFLMVMVITLFCYAIIRGKPLKTKITQTDTHVSSTVQHYVLAIAKISCHSYI